MGLYIITALLSFNILFFIFRQGFGESLAKSLFFPITFILFLIDSYNMAKLLKGKNEHFSNVGKM